jgi:4'-phosphopantetheinyl transferase
MGFSVSHCDTHTVVAVAPISEIGVDVENRRANVDIRGIASRYFAPEEASQLDTLPQEEAEERFLRLWVCKEAFVKAIGLGLSYPLDRFVVSETGAGDAAFGWAYTRIEAAYGPASEWSIRMWAPAPDCWIAVAARMPDAVVTHTWWDAG